MARQKLIHLHGSDDFTKAKATAKGVKLGEIAVKHNQGNSELYVVTNEETGEFDKFINATVIGANISNAISTLVSAQGQVGINTKNIGELQETVNALVSGDTSVDAQINDAIEALVGKDGQVGINTAAINDIIKSGGTIDVKVGAAVDSLKKNELTELANDITDITKSGGTIDSKVAAAVSGLTNGPINDIIKSGGTIDVKVGEAVVALGKVDDELAKDITDITKSGGTIDTKVAAAVSGLTNGAINDIIKSGGTIDTKVAAAVSGLTNGAINDIIKSGGTIDTKVAAAKKDLEDNIINPHINDTDIHVTTAQTKTWTDAATRINTFMDSEEVAGTIDTLHEIQAWMDTDGKNAADILQAIADEAKVRDDGDKEIKALIGGEYTSGSTVHKAISDLNSNKADKGDSLADYGILDAYTKEQANEQFSMAKTAVQTVVVTNTSTNNITATKSDTTVTLNFDNMVIDCGTY